MATLTKCIRLDVYKVLDVEDPRPTFQRLHDIRNIQHRLMNAVIRDLVIGYTDAKPDVHPQTQAYRSFGVQLERERQQAREKLEKTSTKKEQRAFFERLAALQLPGSMMSAGSTAAYTRWSTDRVDMFVGTKSVPSFKKGCGIYVRGDGWSLGRDERGTVASIKLEGGTAKSSRFAVGVEGGHSHAALKRILSGEYKIADLRIVFDERHRRWCLMAAYSFEAVDTNKDPERRIALHRGMRSFLTFATSDGETHVFDEGGDVKAFKDQMHRRRRTMMAKVRVPGKGSRGHGRARAFRNYEALDTIEKRWVTNKCRQVAAAAIRTALAKNCGTIVIEDYSAKELADSSSNEFVERWIRRWPFYQMAEAIKWSAKKNGLVVEVVPSAYESCICPACGNIDAAQDKKNGTFACSNEACQIKRSVDGVAAWNMLRQATGTSGAFESSKKKLRAVTKRLKDGGRSQPSNGA